MAAVLYLAIILASVAAVYFKFLYRKRRPGEPHLVPGHWLFGNSLEFGEHAQKYLTKMREKYGDIFTIRLLGKHWTMMLDVHSFERVPNEKNFDFAKVKDEVNVNVFHCNLKDTRRMVVDAGQRVNGKYMLLFMENFDKNLHKAFDQRFPEDGTATVTAGDPKEINNAINKRLSLEAKANILTKSTVDTDIEYLLTRDLKLGKAEAGDDDNGNEGWYQGDLREICGETFFSAIFYSLFGRLQTEEPIASFNPRSFMRSLDMFNVYFTLMWLGLPRWLFPSAVRAGKVLAGQPDPMEMAQREGVSKMIEFVVTKMKENGQSDADIKGLTTVLLHVNFNSFRAAFWCAYKLMEKPQALAAIRKELQEAVDMKRSGDEAEKTVDFTYEEINKLPLLDSFMKEVIRSTCGVFMTRLCNADTQFTLDNGKTYLIRRGDRVAVIPPVFHKDPEIFHDPEEFIYDRFVDAEFFKNGKKVKNPVIGFGALCPAQKLSTVEVKWFVMNLVNIFKMELLPGETTSPDTKLYGQEILSPRNPVQVRMKRKEGVARLRFVNNYNPRILEEI